MCRMRWALALLALSGCNLLLGIEQREFEIPVDAPVARPDGGASRVCFTEAFDQPLPTRWQVSRPTNDKVKFEITGKALVGSLAAGIVSDNGIGSLELFDMTSGYFQGELVTPPPDGTYTALTVSDDAQYYVVIETMGVITLVKYFANGAFSSAFPIEGHRYFRIRHQGENVVFEASPDGLAWANPYPVSGAAPARATLGVIAGTNNGEASGVVSWDNLKLKTQDCDPP